MWYSVGSLQLFVLHILPVTILAICTIITSEMNHYVVWIGWHKDVNILERVQQNISEIWKRGKRCGNFFEMFEENPIIIKFLKCQPLTENSGMTIKWNKILGKTFSFGNLRVRVSREVVLFFGKLWKILLHSPLHLNFWKCKPKFLVEWKAPTEIGPSFKVLFRRGRHRIRNASSI